MSEDVSEMLEYVRACFQVIRHVRPKLSCQQCERIVQAPAPSRPIARGLAGPGLLAHVLVSKYADHLPLYRQCEIYERQGIELERSTLADWVASADTFLGHYSDEQSRAFDARLLEEVRSTPGVIDVSSTALAPLSGGYLGDGHVYIEDEIPVPDYERLKVFYDRVGAIFFRTMGTPVLAGRDFTERDVNGSAQVAVVNQTLAVDQRK